MNLHIYKRLLYFSRITYILRHCDTSNEETKTNDNRLHSQDRSLIVLCRTSSKIRVFREDPVNLLAAILSLLL